MPINETHHLLDNKAKNMIDDKETTSNNQQASISVHPTTEPPRQPEQTKQINAKPRLPMPTANVEYKPPVPVPHVERDWEHLSDEVNYEQGLSRLGRRLKLDAYRFLLILFIVLVACLGGYVLYESLKSILNNQLSIVLSQIHVNNTTDNGADVDAQVKVNGLDALPIDFALQHGHGELSADGKPFVRVNFPDTIDLESKAVHVNMQVNVVDEALLEKFMDNVIADAQVPQGTFLMAHVRAASKRFPSLGLPVSLDWPLKQLFDACKSKWKPVLKHSIESMELGEDKAGNGLCVNAVAKVQLPGCPLSIALPKDINIQVDLLYGPNSVKIGHLVTASPLKVQAAEQRIRLQGSLINPTTANDPQVQDALEDCIKNLVILGQPVSLTLQGNSQGGNVPAKWMRAGIDRFRMSVLIDPRKLTNGQKLSRKLQKNALLLTKKPSIAAVSALNFEELAKKHLRIQRVSLDLLEDEAVLLAGFEAAIKDLPMDNVELLDVSFEGKLVTAPIKDAAAGIKKQPTQRFNKTDILVPLKIPPQRFTPSRSGFALKMSQLKVVLDDDNRRNLARLPLVEDLQVNFAGTYTLNFKVHGQKLSIKDKAFAVPLYPPPQTIDAGKLVDAAQHVNWSAKLNENSGEALVDIDLQMSLRQEKYPWLPKLLHLGQGITSKTLRIVFEGKQVGQVSLGTTQDDRMLSLNIIVTDEAFFSGQPHLRAEVFGIAVNTADFKPVNLVKQDVLESFLVNAVKEKLGSALELLDRITLVSCLKAPWPAAVSSLHNSLGLTITILGISHLQVYKPCADDKLIYLTTIDEPTLPEPIVIPAHGTVESSPIPVKFEGNPRDALKTLKDLFLTPTHQVPISLRNGLITVKIGTGFEVQVPYSQDNVPLSYQVRS